MADGSHGPVPVGFVLSFVYALSVAEGNVLIFVTKKVAAEELGKLFKQRGVEGLFVVAVPC